MKYLSIMVLSVLLLTGCSPYIAKIEYKGTRLNSIDAIPSINEVVVSDQRGTASNWLGAIRGSYGNVRKRLLTEEPTAIVVDKMYTDALNNNGLYTESKDAPYNLKVTILKFDCSYLFNREAHVNVNVSLVDNFTSKIKFSRNYRTDEVEKGMFGGDFFRDEETLRNLAETVMNKTIEKTLVDSAFIKSLSSIDDE